MLLTTTKEQKCKKRIYKRGEKVADFRFNEDFANNWKSGQTVTCEKKRMVT